MEVKQLRLSGKVAIVTGAGSSGPGVGTGKAAAILFAREGARVLLVDQVGCKKFVDKFVESLHCL